ncbi:MAG: LysE family translocator [Aeromonas molluscorum]
MSLTAFLAYGVALAIAAAIPGPGVAAIVGRALGTGARRTLPMLLGLAVGDVVYLSLAVGGLAFIANSFFEVFLVIKICGALYLVYLAYKFWTAGIDIQDVKKSAGRREGFTSFMAGLAVTLGNPKTIIFYMAILPVVMNLEMVSFEVFLLLIVITFAVLFLVMAPYILLATKARMFFKNPAALRRLNRTASVAMAATATWIVART